MTRTLRSNFEYGSSRWAGRRALWRALGLTEEDMQKPKIAVVNSSNELAICFSHLDGVAARVKEAIRAAGGTPFEVRTAAPSDFVTSAGHRGGYILPTRDLIVNDIEVQVEGALLDGMVTLASCDKTMPGQMMAAGRLNIPTLAVICGYQPSGRYKGQRCDIEDVFMAAGHVASGRLAAEELEAMTEVAISGPGVCSGMGTANTMHVACEALGMALPGSAPVLANSPAMFAQAEAAGKRIVQMVWDDLKPRDILTREAFANAAMVMLALSGSVNSVKHLQAIAMEAECDVDVYRLFEENADRIPLIAAIRPNGEKTIEEFEAAGGARAAMKSLEKFLHKEARSVNGQTVGEILAAATIADEEVVRPAERPLATRPSIVVVRGSLAPQGAIVKLAVGEDRPLTFDGPAIIYHSREEVLEGIAKGEVKEGQVVVMRGMGLKGGPGMSFGSAAAFALDGAGLAGKVALLTDGQLSGLVNVGIVVGEVSPESAEDGPLAWLENGDRIAIDIRKRVVNLEVPEAVLAARRKELKLRPPTHERGWLSIYQRTVRPLPQGAVLLRDE